jgi:hypothetical protein
MNCRGVEGKNYCLGSGRTPAANSCMAVMVLVIRACFAVGSSFDRPGACFTITAARVPMQDTQTRGKIYLLVYRLLQSHGSAL